VQGRQAICFFTALPAIEGGLSLAALIRKIPGVEKVRVQVPLTILIRSRSSTIAHFDRSLMLAKSFGERLQGQSGDGMQASEVAAYRQVVWEKSSTCRLSRSPS
jgi:hypothetical protein